MRKLALLLLLLAQPLWAADQAASSCSNVDVQTAVNAAGDCDTVTVPSGSCTWTGNVAWSNKGIFLDGRSGRPAVTNGNKSSSGLIQITPGTAACRSRIAGFDFDANDAGGDSDLVLVLVAGDESDERFRFDHNVIGGNGNFVYIAGVRATGGQRVLVDKNHISNFQKDLVQLVGKGDSAWSEAEAFADASKNSVIESNVFLNPGLTSSAFNDALEGSRYVARWNYALNVGFVNHGQCSSSPGVRHYEIYYNTLMLNAGDSPANWIFLRGGTGAVFGNIFDDLGASEINLAEFKLSVGGAVCGAVGASPADWCCCSPPCTQQIGRGQAGSVPLYIYSNTMLSGSFSVGVTDDDGGCEGATECNASIDPGTFIVADTDYIIGTAKPGYDWTGIPVTRNGGNE